MNKKENIINFEPQSSFGAIFNSNWYPIQSCEKGVKGEGLRIFRRLSSGYLSASEDDTNLMLRRKFYLKRSSVKTHFCSSFIIRPVESSGWNRMQGTRNKLDKLSNTHCLKKKISPFVGRVTGFQKTKTYLSRFRVKGIYFHQNWYFRRIFSSLFDVSLNTTRLSFMKPKLTGLTSINLCELATWTECDLIYKHLQCSETPQRSVECGVSLKFG